MKQVNNALPMLLQARNASQLEDIENNYILSKKFENLIGDISLGVSSKFEIWNNGCTGASLLNGVISGVPTATWSELGVTVLNMQNYIGRTLMFTAFASTDGISDESLQPMLWKFNNTTNLGSVSGNISKSVPVGTKVRFTRMLTIASGYDRIKFGIQEVTTPLSKISVEKVMVIDITDNPAFNPDDSFLGGYWAGYAPAHAVKLYYENQFQSKWKDKKVLCIGDSLTAALKYQAAIASYHGAIISTHAKGGIGIPTCVDGNGSDLVALTQSQVSDKDLIILFIGMNERGTLFGQKGDLYPTNNTIWGKMQYVINRIFTLLTDAGNLKCKLIVITPHCAGKYQYIDVDGYGEYPIGTGQTLELLSNTIKTIAQYNSCQCIDLWHDSGINKFTWSIFSASPTATYGTPYNGTPYPNNADQLHLSDLGYARIGELIAERMSIL